MIKDCDCCECQYYVGKKYHQKLIEILLIIAKISIHITKPQIWETRELENKIIELQNIYEED